MLARDAVDVDIENDTSAWRTSVLALADILRLKSCASGESLEDDLVISRRAAWIKVGDGRSASVGIQGIVAVLSKMVDATQRLQTQFARIREEFVCLDDGEAEEFFGGRGPLGVASDPSFRAGAAAESCQSTESELSKGCTTLGQVSSVWVELPDPVPIAMTLQNAVVVLCESLSLASLLDAYRQAAVIRARATIEVGSMVTKVRKPQEYTSLDQMEFEIRHGCSFGMWRPLCRRIGLKAPRDLLRPPTHDRLQVWDAACARAERLMRTLQRRHHYFSSSCREELAVLDCIFHAFDKLTGMFARLQEEIICMNKTGVDAFPAILLSAATVQMSALEWKCKILAKPDTSDFSSATLLKMDVGPFTDFLEETLAVGDTLETYIVRLAQKRDCAVDFLKATAESAGWLQWRGNSAIRNGGA
jgi:hypothetical protein